MWGVLYARAQSVPEMTEAAQTLIEVLVVALTGLHPSTSLIAAGAIVRVPRDFWSRLVLPRVVPSYVEWNAKVIAEMQVLLDAI